MREPLSAVPVQPAAAEETPWAAAANVRVLAASMEMNESSRWTEEEMETAKKGEGVGAWPPSLRTQS